ncbi:MAG: hypothetical protein JRI68_09355 [Deltaproteobacteria bacterium]|nr:hypothetical protein [Deltaproteobacteria bacterium]
MTKKLALLAFLLLAALFAAVVTPGCAQPCNDLWAMCGQCPDAAAVRQCRDIVNAADDDACSDAMDSLETACGTGEGGSGQGGSTSGCENGQTLCDGQCVSLNADADFCGSCNVQCDDGLFCAAGICVGACPAALPTACGETNGCVNLDADPLNCGECGAVCPEGEVCSQGDCAANCDPESGVPTLCDGGCVNLATDLLNCGQCGNGCTPAQLCSVGACASECTDGLTQCCGTCVDINSDPTHCGQILCADCDADPLCEGVTPVCSEGACADECAAGLTDCAGACVDLNEDGAHCGGCGNVCGGGVVCAAGACSTSGCPDGLTQCGSSCVNTDEDPANCGECGNVCDPQAEPAGNVCNLGSCQSACTGGMVDCGGSCVDTQSDPDHCGGCNNACQSSQVCQESGQTASCTTACESLYTNCDGACVQLDGHVSHCGSCGNSCGDANICTADSCSNGECSNPSGGMSCDDHNACTEDACDPKKACTHTAYTQTEVETLCQQLEGLDPVNGCVWCNPVDKLCNQGDVEGATCSIIAPNGVTLCGTCVPGSPNQPWVCDNAGQNLKVCIKPD